MNEQLTAADGHRFGAYVAAPAARPRGALVVVQEIFGVNSHMRSVADGLAADGYLAIAPALFDRVERGVDLGYGEADIQRGFALKTATGNDRPLLDIAAAMARVGSAGKVGVIGYCWGGLLSWLAACSLDGLAASVAVLRRRHSQPCVAEAALPGAGAFRRPRQPHSARHRGGLSGCAAGRDGPALSRAARLQLRPARFVRRRERGPGTRAHAGVPAPTHRLSHECARAPDRRVAAGRSRRWELRAPSPTSARCSTPTCTTTTRPSRPTRCPTCWLACNAPACARSSPTAGPTTARSRSPRPVPRPRRPA